MTAEIKIRRVRSPTFYRLDKVILTHYLVLPKEGHFKNGYLFVGFRLKSQPEKLWLFDGLRWAVMDDNTGPHSFMTTITASDNPLRPYNILQPIVPTYISDFPINVQAYANDGELLVGYGITNDPGSIQEAFNEMSQNNRFKVLWEIGSNTLNTLLETVCLNITEMTVITPTLQHNHSK